MSPRSASAFSGRHRAYLLQDSPEAGPFDFDYVDGDYSSDTSTQWLGSTAATAGDQIYYDHDGQAMGGAQRARDFILFPEERRSTSERHRPPQQQQRRQYHQDGYALVPTHRSGSQYVDDQRHGSMVAEPASSRSHGGSRGAGVKYERRHDSARERQIARESRGGDGRYHDGYDEDQRRQPNSRRVPRAPAIPRLPSPNFDLDAADMAADDYSHDYGYSYDDGADQHGTHRCRDAFCGCCPVPPEDDPALYRWRAGRGKMDRQTSDAQAHISRTSKARRSIAYY